MTKPDISVETRIPLSLQRTFPVNVAPDLTETRDIPEKDV
jgi:hypothetical protein